MRITNFWIPAEHGFHSVTVPSGSETLSVACDDLNVVISILSNGSKESQETRKFYLVLENEHIPDTSSWAYLGQVRARGLDFHVLDFGVDR